MMLPFTKMHGLGNDFVVIDATKKPIELTPEQIRKLADRHLGIGCDQLLMLTASSEPGIDFGYRIFNADGKEVEQCGNGARCIAEFIRVHQLSDKEQFRVSTSKGVLTLRLESPEEGIPQASVEMGVPVVQAQHRVLQINQMEMAFTRVDLGNPHAVTRVPDVSVAPVEKIGQALQHHPEFPEGVNVGFMERVSQSEIRLRVYERGVGETLACGSGACAAAVAAMLGGDCEQTVNVVLSGGQLSISWPGPGQTLWQKGAAELVFTGNFIVS